MSLVRGNFRSVFAIIGGGALGAATLRELVEGLIAQGLARRAEIRLFEKAPTLGRGLAYAHDEEFLLLNQTAQTMSAVPDDPAHFYRWLVEKKGLSLPDGGDSYVSRPRFGEYLEDVVRDARARAEAACLAVRIVRDEVIDIDGDQIITRAGEIHRADRVVLALGNLPSTEFLHLSESPNYLPSPYPSARIKALIPKGARVGIIGSRLSAIDAALALRHFGHEGPVSFLSRSGLLPCVRGGDLLRPLRYISRELVESRDSLRLNDVVEMFSRELELAEGAARHDWTETLGLRLAAAERLERQLADVSPKTWQQVMVATNEVIEQVWHRLCDQDKRVFRKQFYGAWLSFRVGMPEANARRIAAMAASGQLTIQSGVKDVRAAGDGFAVARFDEAASEQFDFIINATGNADDVAKIGTGLVATLRDRGTIAAHPFGGMRVEFESGRVVAADGARHAHLYAVGNLTSGTYLLTSSLRMNLAHVKRITRALVAHVFTKEGRRERSVDIQSKNSEVHAPREMARSDGR